MVASASSEEGPKDIRDMQDFGMQISASNSIYSKEEKNQTEDSHFRSIKGSDQLELKVI